MTRRRDAVTRVVATAVVAGAVLGTACDDEAVPASPSIALPARTPLAGGAEAPLPSEVTLIAHANQFDKAVLHVAAGHVTVGLDNRDAGGVHNLAVFAGDDATRSPVAATRLSAGPATAVLMFQAAPGVYYFSCQVHPDMRGTISAS